MNNLHHANTSPDYTMRLPVEGTLDVLLPLEIAKKWYDNNDDDERPTREIILEIIFLFNQKTVQQQQVKFVLKPVEDGII